MNACPNLLQMKNSKFSSNFMLIFFEMGFCAVHFFPFRFLVVISFTWLKLPPSRAETWLSNLSPADSLVEELTASVEETVINYGQKLLQSDNFSFRSLASWHKKGHHLDARGGSGGSGSTPKVKKAKKARNDGLVGGGNGWYLRATSECVSYSGANLAQGC